MPCKKISLTQGQFTIVDETDFERLSKFKWRAHFNNSTGRFVVERGNHRTGVIYMHNDIMNPSEGFQVDHRNLDSLNNQRSNLRICTFQQNCCNRRLRLDNKLGFKGVQRRTNGFIARIMINGKRRSAGTFKTVLEAAKGYNDAALKYYGEFARLNHLESEGY